MKITAEFDSINSADIAAAAIRKQISPFSDISTSEINSHKKQNIDGNILLFGNYNMPCGSYNTYSMPIITGDDNPFNETDLRSAASLEVVCRREDEINVSGIIINHGGYKIKVLS
ncbi:MAG: hypothetical protein LUI05_07400 [Oscillospiraceae bacterium]|nr:hypothetical protein [Oscillospiraceae bacterium]